MVMMSWQHMTSSHQSRRNADTVWLRWRELTCQGYPFLFGKHCNLIQLNTLTSQNRINVWMRSISNLTVRDHHEKALGSLLHLFLTRVFQNVGSAAIRNRRGGFSRIQLWMVWIDFNGKFWVNGIPTIYGRKRADSPQELPKSIAKRYSKRYWGPNLSFVGRYA